jgi:hypothetical protein
MKFDKLLGFAKRIALTLVAREVERVLAKADRPKDVTLERVDGGVAVEGKDIKARTVTDAAVRNIAR